MKEFTSEMKWVKEVRMLIKEWNVEKEWEKFAFWEKLNKCNVGGSWVPTPKLAALTLFGLKPCFSLDVKHLISSQFDRFWRIL